MTAQVIPFAERAAAIRARRQSDPIINFFAVTYWWPLSLFMAWLDSLERR